MGVEILIDQTEPSLITWKENQNLYTVGIRIPETSKNQTFVKTSYWMVIISLSNFRLCYLHLCQYHPNIEINVTDNRHSALSILLR